MKKIKYSLLFIAGFCLSQELSAQAPSTISEAEVTRIVKTLSADDMQGRASFTPGIEKAADFIKNEFQQIGLQPMPGNDGFKQNFKVYRLTPTETEIKLNGHKLQPEKAFAVTSQREIEWKKKKNIPVITITEQDDFRAAFGKIYSSDKDALVLVNPKHAEAFSGMRRYFTRGSVKEKINEGSSKVFILSEISDERALRKYDIEIEQKVEELQLTNVVGKIEGKRKDEVVLFSGHYDHIGIHKPLAGDSIANGADDDASGTTAMIILANYYKQQPQPERTLVFVAFAAEEIGGFGSKFFSKQLNPDNIVAMLNIEMVGKPSKFGPNNAYLTGFDRSDLGKLLQQRLAGTPYSIHPDPYPDQNLFYRSDNATLARLGVPAHTLSSVQIDQDTTYHTVKDEFDKLDMPHLTSMIRAIALAAQGVVNGEDTPTRIDKALVE
ncbi:M20/M25/M40 family metallo-hydrolase [Pontibacter sp. MBLB2868]|uniref:M20/M25/M40 family metallo-hydrolase n=1 Tax=Pontibacter sp. MBLB2868 TaxID=3451555 RepID=UPI003F756F6E